MNIKLIVASLFLSCLLFACGKQEGSVTKQKDYNKYLVLEQNENLQKTLTREEFWQNKLEDAPTQFPYLFKLAGIKTELFGITGKVKYLNEACSDLLILNEKTNFKNSGYLRGLSRNYISQHKFKSALEMLKLAEMEGENLNATQKMLFDIHLELGNNEEAEMYLNKIEDYKDFDFIIRKSKWCDHQGDLDGAIDNMEIATHYAEDYDNKVLKIWSYTNLADFYGHAGRIQNSYDLYLKTLELDQHNAYALKGLAWIEFSHEKNPKEALRILHAVSLRHQSPDYYLLKAEIADFQNDKIEKEKQLTQFMNSVSSKEYGNMYNKYTATLYAEEYGNYSEAIAIAEQEIMERPTPQSYDLLAWSYYNKGDYKKALEIAENNIYNKTSEPEACYHMAEIFKANNKTELTESLLPDLRESYFELGPGAVKNIINL